MNSRTITFKMFSKFQHLFSKQYYLLSENKKESLKVLIDFEKNTDCDSYSIDIHKGSISIKASSERGVLYAIDVLNSLPEVRFGKIALPIVLIEDEPSFCYRGIIEGYYGTPWTFSERMNMFDFMRQHRLNTYIYAPKSDVYHRERWCDLYQESFLKKLSKMVTKATDLKINFWYTISPGYHKEGLYAFNYRDESDFQRLFEKIDQLISIGIRDFGLLLDDIDYELSAENVKRFNRPGIAHAYICNRLLKYIQTKISDTKFVMCPTEYHQIGETQYRADLRDHLHQDILVFFTGDNVCAEAITERDISVTKQAYNKEMCIWDNFPVSDFTYGVREFMGPITNRSTRLSQYAKGYFINPSIHYHISKVGMSTMSDYAWNTSAYHPALAFEKALKEFGEAFYKSSKAFIKFNYPSVLSYGDIEEHHQWVLDGEDDKILALYERLETSAQNMLQLNLDVIHELKPWLEHAIMESKIVSKIIHKDITKETLLDFLKDSHFLGSELIDELIAKENLLTEEEYNEKITKRRGPLWYRVFEEKRWKK